MGRDIEALNNRIAQLEQDLDKYRRPLDSDEEIEPPFKEYAYDFQEDKQIDGLTLKSSVWGFDKKNGPCELKGSPSAVLDSNGYVRWRGVCKANGGVIWAAVMRVTFYIRDGLDDDFKKLPIIYTKTLKVEVNANSSKSFDSGLRYDRRLRQRYNNIRWANMYISSCPW